MVEMFSRPGKTAPRLIEDLLNYDPRFEAVVERNILTEPPPQFDETKPHLFTIPQGSCRHAFMTKFSQSKVPPTSPWMRPGDEPVYKIASFCIHCRYHLDLIVDQRGGLWNGEPCPKAGYPLHHFVYVPHTVEGEPKIPAAYSEDECFRFQCTNDRCETRAWIRVRPPIIQQKHITLLVDPDALEKRLVAAKEIDPDRRDLTRARPGDGFDYLISYIRDSMTPSQHKKKIPLRNRKFLVTYGRDLDELLIELGFAFQEPTVEEDASWHLPTPPEDAADPFAGDSERRRLEDVKDELTALLHALPDDHKLGLRNYGIQPVPSLRDIERALGAHNYEKTPSARANVDMSLHEHPYYASLGALSSFSDNLLLFAYDRQVECDPRNSSYYFECLQDLAKGRKSEMLEMRVMVLASNGQTNRKDVERAYAYFGMEMKHAAELSDDLIIGLFRSRLQDIGSAQEAETREMLRVIGQARQSGAILAQASNAIETYAQALSWIGVTEHTDDDWVLSMVATKISEGSTNKDIAQRAVEIIARERRSDKLNTWLLTGTAAEPGMDLAEAYQLFDIQDRSKKPDLEVLRTTLDLKCEDQPERAEKLNQAYALICRENFGSGEGGSMFTNPANQHPLGSWPVGFQNIGNTCYLNSILQFLFTVKPLRELVLRYDQSTMGPTSEENERRKVGGRSVSRDEVQRAQEFVEELKKLFNSMITAPAQQVRPEVRLACLALKKPDEDTPFAKPEEHQPNGLGFVDGFAVSGPLPPPSPKQDNIPAAPKGSAASDTSEGTLIGLDVDMDEATKDAAKTTRQDNKLEGGNQSIASGSFDMQADKNPSHLHRSDSMEVLNGDEGGRWMEDAPAEPARPPPVPPRPQTDRVPQDVEFAARQQDVSEVMNNILFQLECAIKPQELRAGEQFDIIKELFFGTLAKTMLKEAKTEAKEELFDTIIINVGSGPRHIYAALDDYFDRDDIDVQPDSEVEAQGLTKFETIKQLPPILQFNVQRVGFDKEKKMPFKIEHLLELEEKIYLDRYLAETPSKSAAEIMSRRTASWDSKKTLKAYQRRKSFLQKGYQDLSLVETVKEAANYLSSLEHESTPDSDMVDLVDVHVNPSTIEQMQQRAEELEKETAEVEADIAQEESKLAQLFSDMQDCPYSLHTVFIHRGTAGGGHYFVYIRDFVNGIWRKYNDENVTEVEQREVFTQDTYSPATSTGVVYVRDDMKETLVEAVNRSIESQAQPKVTKTVDTDMGNLEVIDGQLPPSPPPSPPAVTELPSHPCTERKTPLRQSMLSFSVVPEPSPAPEPSRDDGEGDWPAGTHKLQPRSSSSFLAGRSFSLKASRNDGAVEEQPRWTHHRRTSAKRSSSKAGDVPSSDPDWLPVAKARKAIKSYGKRLKGKPK